MAQAAMSRREESDAKLKKALSLHDLFFLSMGGIIGSGWLFAVLGAAGRAGPAVILSWIIGGALVLIIALTYAEVAGMLPRSGAIVRYPHLTHGGFTGFMLGWAYMLTAVTVPTIEAEGVVSYAQSYLPKIFPHLHIALTFTDKATGVKILNGAGIGVAVVLMILFTILNYYGVRLLGRLNTIITWWKFIIPGLTVVLLFFAFRGSNFAAGKGFFAMGIPALFQAIPLSGIVFSYLGFRQALDFGGEARNAQRDVPRATIYSVVAAVIFYVLLQIVFIGALNWHSLGLSVGNWGGLGNSSWADGPFAHELQSGGLALMAGFAYFLYLDSFVSPSGTGMVYMGTSTRTIYGLSIDDYLPPIFTRVSVLGTPIAALIAALVVGLIFLLPLPSWYLLVGFISSATVLTYIMGGVGLTVLRRTAGELPRPFMLKGAQVLAPLAFIAAGLIVYWSGTATLNYVVAAVFIGLPLYAWFYAPRQMGISQQTAIALGVVFLIAVIATGYFGPFYAAGPAFVNRGGLGFLPYVGLLFVEVVAFAGALYALANAAGKREIIAGAWFVGFLFLTYLLSYFGAFGPLAHPRIAFPLDTVLAALLGLAAYYAAVVSGYRTADIAAIVAHADATGTNAGATTSASE